MLLTGARPGKELDNLRWRQVDLAWEREGQKFVKIIITAGKTIKYSRVRQRAITAPAGVAAPPFKALMAWQGPGTEDGDFVFRLPDGSRIGNMQASFRTILEKIGMLYDIGDPPARRTLYSFRHSYATTQIVHGTMSLIELATHMGTSVAMLEQHYAHLGPLAIAPKVAANAVLISPHRPRRGATPAPAAGSRPCPIRATSRRHWPTSRRCCPRSATGWPNDNRGRSSS